MPRYSATTKANFLQLWSDWKSECLKAADEHLKVRTTTKSIEFLQDLLRIMSGQCDGAESVFDVLSFYCESWQDMVGAMLLFHFPTMAPHRVG